MRQNPPKLLPLMPPRKGAAVDAVTKDAVAADAVAVERISIKKGRLSMLVRLAPHAPRLAPPHLVSNALSRYPSLPHHACVNDRGPTFSAVMRATSLPHLLEHLIIDAQVRDPATPRDVSLVGTTEWLDEANGFARVEVNFTDDLVALRAVREAVSFVNEGMVS